MGFGRVVAATDLSVNGQEVIRVAGSLAEQLGAELIGLHVLSDERWSSLRESLPEESAYVDVIEQRLTTDVEAQLTSVATSVRTRAEVLVGHEAETIHSFVTSEQADLLAIGIRNRSRVGKLLMGSIAQELLLGAPCPIVGVPVGN